MDNAQLLLKYLKSKGIISNLASAKKEIVTAEVKLKKESDLFIRDSITGMGTILKEDFESHYYITCVKIGKLGNALAYAIIVRRDLFAEIVVYAHEGLVKQNLASKAIEKLANALS